MWTVARSLILLLIPLACFGQLSPQAKAIFQAASVPKVVSGGGGGFTPTNVASALAYYVVSWGNYRTNGAPDHYQTTLSDLWTNQWNLTSQDMSAVINSKAPGQILSDSGINNYNALLFQTNYQTYLFSNTYTSAQPHEVVMVLKDTSYFTDAYCYMDGKDGTYGNRAYWGNFSGWGFIMTCGNFVNSNVQGITNRYAVYDFVFNGSGNSSAIYTNNILGASGLNTGNNGCKGLVLGSDFTVSESFASFNLAALASYSAVLDSTTRSNVYWYFTNLFNLSL